MGTIFKKIKKALNKPSLVLQYIIGKNFIARLFSDKNYVRLKYRLVVGKKLNLTSPKTFNEKLQWLKLYDRKPEYTQMVDKYGAREYIARKAGEEYLIPLLGVWDKVEDIDFDSLPEQFVLKSTHDSGNVVVCRDRAAFDVVAAKKKLKKALKRKYFYGSREWPYKNVEPRIIAENYMEDESSEGTALGLTDYKFYCFNGVPKLVYVSQGLEDHSTARISFLNLDWSFAPFKRVDYKPFDTVPSKPVNYEKMLELSSVISADQIFLRVDFYEIKQKVYISELTFCPTSGMVPLAPPEWDDILGTWLKLPIEE